MMLLIPIDWALKEHVSCGEHVLGECTHIFKYVLQVSRLHKPRTTWRKPLRSSTKNSCSITTRYNLYRVVDTRLAGRNSVD